MADSKTPTEQEIQAEYKLRRRLQFMMSMVMDVIRQDPKMPPEEATELIASAKKAALRMFPGHEQAYDWIYRPRFQRLLNEKYGLQ